MKKILVLIILVLMIGIIAAPVTVYAQDSSADKTLEENVDELLDELDTSDLEEFFNGLDSSGQSVFGAGSVSDKIQKIISGELQLDYSSFFSYIFSIIGIDFLKFLPMVLSIVAIMIAFNIINSLNATSSNEGISNIVRFSMLALVLIILLTQFYLLLSGAIKLIQSLQSQINIFFPIMLTLMAATGANASVAVYSPSVAILGAGLTNLITFIAVPALLLSLVFNVVGSLSKTINLKNMSDFFLSAAKWLLGTAFFVFAAMMAVQGITASVHDGISIRATKFALSKYVPIIGGYLSEGFNLIMAGNVLIKNALGMSAIVMLFLYIAPVVIQLIVFTLSIKLTAAVCEPMGNSEITGVLNGFSKSSSVLTAIILGITFLYFLFLIMVISTGNLAL